MSAATERKAVRLRAEGAVREFPARAFFVRGDSDTYLVTLSAETDAGHCTCPATTECSHLLACRAEAERSTP